MKTFSDFLLNESEDSKYQSFVKMMMKKHNFDLNKASDEDKATFFNKVDKEYNAKDEAGQDGVKESKQCDDDCTDCEDCNNQLDEIDTHTLMSYTDKIRSKVKSLDNHSKRLKQDADRSQRIADKLSKKTDYAGKMAHKERVNMKARSLKRARELENKADTLHNKADKASDYAYETKYYTVTGSMNGKDQKMMKVNIPAKSTEEAKEKSAKKGMKNIEVRLKESTQLDELSKQKLDNYKEKAFKNFDTVTDKMKAMKDKESPEHKALEKKSKNRVKGLLKAVVKIHEDIDVFFCEETNEHYIIELNEETLTERKIVIRVNSKGKRIKRIKCPPGRIVKTVNGRKVCAMPTGRQKLVKKIAIRRSVRTKKGKGAGFKRKVNFKRQRAIRHRKRMGLKNQTQVG